MNRTITFSTIFAFLFILSSFNQAFAQEDTQYKEIGIGTSTLRQFEVIYKKQKSENSYSRLRFASGEFSLVNVDPFNVTLNLGFGGGVEKRRNLSEKFYLVTGIDILGRLNTSLKSKPNISLTPSIGPVIGCSYLANDNFLLGFEIFPSASFQFGIKNDKFFFSDLGFNFSTTSAALFVVYRFTK